MSTGLASVGPSWLAIAGARMVGGSSGIGGVVSVIWILPGVGHRGCSGRLGVVPRTLGICGRTYTCWMCYGIDRRCTYDISHWTWAVATEPTTPCLDPSAMGTTLWMGCVGMLRRNGPPEGSGRSGGWISRAR